MAKNSNNVKLIVFDVDGTLVDDGQVLREKTISAIRDVQAMGIPVSLATGKIFPSVENLVRLLDIQIPLILANGAIIQRPDQEIISSKFLGPDLVNEITTAKFPYDAEMALFVPHNIFVKEETYNTEHISVEFKEKIEAVGDWRAVERHFSEVCKAIWINRLNVSEIGEITKLLSDRYSGRVALSMGSPASIEAMPTGVSKQTGLENLAAYLHIPLDSIMVFGDQHNDYGMMAAAGISVAVGNAIEDVKEISDYVIGTNNEEGPAEFLIDYFSL